jgi:Lytic transglycolase
MRHLYSLTAISIFLTTSAFADQVRATWYGNEHRGHKTASGQVFNPEGLTAAHKSLPFGRAVLGRGFKEVGRQSSRSKPHRVALPLLSMSNDE